MAPYLYSEQVGLLNLEGLLHFLEFSKCSGQLTSPFLGIQLHCITVTTLTNGWETQGSRKCLVHYHRLNKYRGWFYRTVMRINPGEYASVLCSDAGAFLYIFSFLSLPTPIGMDGSTLKRCGGTQLEEGVQDWWWENISLVNAGTSQTPITATASKADIFTEMSYKNIDVPRQQRCCMVSPCDVKYENLGGAVL